MIRDSGLLFGPPCILDGGFELIRCAPLDVDQFQPVTTATAAVGSDWDEATTDGEHEVSALVERNDETGLFEYTLVSLTSPPYIRLYVPGIRCRQNFPEPWPVSSYTKKRATNLKGGERC